MRIGSRGGRGLLTTAAREAVTCAITEIEAATSAELVVAVRRAARPYREADYLFGFLVAILVLWALLYLPQPFALWVFVPDVTIAFVAGAFVASHTPWIRRVLTPARVRQDSTRCAARATFADLPCSRLPGRNGVLVYVALLERRVEVVADAGLATATADPAWADACRELTAALRPRPDRDRFVLALRRLGAAAARLHPRAMDDINELPDAVNLQ